MRLPAPEGCSDTLAHPVASRRLGGAGISLDLNPDRSCNWRCVYCDTVDLVDSKADRIDVEQLESELRASLEAVRGAGWLEQHAPEGQRELRGLLICGQGEPTLSHQFLPSAELVARVLSEPAGAGLRPILVTNGSNISNRKVREGLELFAKADGEVWFKLDSATREGQRDINRIDSTLRQVRENMRVAAQLCPTIVQTCVFTSDGAPSLDEREMNEYISFLTIQRRANVPLRGVHLYTPDRPSANAEGVAIAAPPSDWTAAFAERIRALDLDVTLFG